MQHQNSLTATDDVDKVGDGRRKGSFRQDWKLEIFQLNRLTEQWDVCMRKGAVTS